MTEPATPKPFFTRRRVIAVAVGVFVLAVVTAVVFVVSEAMEDRGLRMVFVRFDKAEGYPLPVAVVRLINKTDESLEFYTNKKKQEFMARFCCRDEKLVQAWSPRLRAMDVGIITLHAGHELDRIVQMPEDGRIGRWMMYYSMPERGPNPWERIRSLFGMASPARSKPSTISCEQWIQCPNKLPDGTILPPRLLSEPGAKP